jgi:ABC-type multidrug transport system ATPase subunit
MTLEFDGIEFGYGSRLLLNSIHMTCRQNQIVGLLGRNGTGKTTLMRIVFGAIRPDIGSVRINGVQLQSPAFSTQAISYLPQEDFLPPNLRLRSVLRYSGISRDSILEDFPELEGELDLFPGQVSGGRRRLFEVLLVLYGTSRFCLLDEPFTGLSPLFIERLHGVMIREKQNKGIILSDHLFREVIRIADNIYVLTNGRTFEISGTDGLVRRGYLV